MVFSRQTTLKHGWSRIQVCGSWSHILEICIWLFWGNTEGTQEYPYHRRSESKSDRTWKDKEAEGNPWSTGSIVGVNKAVQLIILSMYSICVYLLGCVQGGIIFYFMNYPFMIYIYTRCCTLSIFRFVITYYGFKHLLYFI